MIRVDYQEKIIKALSWLKTEVDYHNSLSLTDINHAAEDFYCGLLNLVYGYNLKNINITEQNAAAIDLGDEQKKIAIQVTSTSTLAKTKYTVEKFIVKNYTKNSTSCSYSISSKKPTILRPLSVMLTTSLTRRLTFWM